MRKLMWFTVGFTVACAAGVYFLSGLWLLWISLFCLIGFAAMLFMHTKYAKITAAVLLGCMVGFAWLWGFDGIYLAPARNVDGETIEMSITASDYSYETNYGQAFDGHTELHGKSYSVKCYLNEEWATAVRCGKHLSVAAHFCSSFG